MIRINALLGLSVVSCLWAGMVRAEENDSVRMNTLERQYTELSEREKRMEVAVAEFRKALDVQRQRTVELREESGVQRGRIDSLSVEIMNLNQAQHDDRTTLNGRIDKTDSNVAGSTAQSIDGKCRRG